MNKPELKRLPVLAKKSNSVPAKPAIRPASLPVKSNAQKLTLAKPTQLVGKQGSAKTIAKTKKFKR